MFVSQCVCELTDYLAESTNFTNTTVMVSKNYTAKIIILP